jgi:hypothetical protein
MQRGSGGVIDSPAGSGSQRRWMIRTQPRRFLRLAAFPYQRRCPDAQPRGMAPLEGSAAAKRANGWDDCGNIESLEEISP